MGSLVLFLYIADIASALTGIGVVVAVLLSIIIVIIAVAFICEKWSYLFPDYDMSEGQKKEAESKLEVISKILKKLIICWLLALLVTAIIPSKTTMLSIVGYKTATLAVDTQEFNKIRKIVNMKMDKIIESSESDK